MRPAWCWEGGGHGCPLSLHPWVGCSAPSLLLSGPGPALPPEDEELQPLGRRKRIRCVEEEEEEED